MKYDVFGCLIREKYEPEFHKGNLGDSLAETCRIQILGDPYGRLAPFILPDSRGYLRHPMLVNEGKKWNQRDTSNDQVIALFMLWKLEGSPFFIQAKKDNKVFIKGSWIVLAIGTWLVLREHWGLLERANQFQGWLLTKKYRWSDGKRWFEKTEGQVQDYLNLICIHLFLKKIGQPTKLPRPADECFTAVRKYYLVGPDVEPNSDWIVELYRNRLAPLNLPRGVKSE